MTNTKCLACGAGNMPDAKFCSYCRQAMPAAIPINARVTLNASRLACPNCRSENTKAYSIIQAEASQMSGVVRMTSPPIKPHDDSVLLLTLAFAGIFIIVLTLFAFIIGIWAMIVAFFVSVGACAYILICLITPYNRKKYAAYQEKLDLWYRSMLCLRCSRGFCIPS